MDNPVVEADPPLLLAEPERGHGPGPTCQPTTQQQPLFFICNIQGAFGGKEWPIRTKLRPIRAWISAPGGGIQKDGFSIREPKLA